MLFSVLVETRLRPGIADPQGTTIERSLPHLGFEGISRMRVGKAFRFTLEAADEASARSITSASIRSSYRAATCAGVVPPAMRRSIRSSGPLTARPPISGLTATAGTVRDASASRTPGTARIGPIET